MAKEEDARTKTFTNTAGERPLASRFRGRITKRITKLVKSTARITTFRDVIFLRNGLLKKKKKKNPTRKIR